MEKVPEEPDHQHNTQHQQKVSPSDTQHQGKLAQVT